MIKSLIDRNSLINISLIFITFLLCFEVSYYFLLLPVVFHLVNDFMHWQFGFTMFDENILVKRCYQAVDVFLDNCQGKGIDLGFNFYDKNLSKLRAKAQQDKWDFMWEQLNLKAGDNLIDIGCGYGDWLSYAKQRGANVLGVNITPEQALAVKEKYGIEVIISNWQDLLSDKERHQQLYHKFDAVTFMDCIEHFVPSSARNNKKKQAQIYTSMFQLAYDLLNPASKSAQVFLSCLHKVKRDWDFKHRISAYFMYRTLSGYYPDDDNGLLQYSGNYFRLLNCIDKTEDYRITGVLNADHFQNAKINLTLTKVLNAIKFFFVDPYFIHRVLSALFYDAWMSSYGEDAYSREYNPEKRAKVSYVRLWMMTLKRK